MIPIHSYDKRCWAEIDLDAAAANFHTLRRACTGGAKICCVVKANAYGHGALPLARLYERLGADMLAVANLAEASLLRREGISLPILILGYTPPESADELAALSLRQCVFSTDYAEALEAQAAKAGVSVTVHIKLDTGMGRIGFFACDSHSAALHEVAHACRLPHLMAEGIFTHFASADEGEQGRAYTEEQFKRFCDAIAALDSMGIRFAIRHCANSAATLCYPHMQLDMVRVGILLYGIDPMYHGNFIWKPVMQLKSFPILVKELPCGAPVSYGRRFVADSDMNVATLPVGYADGYPRNGEGFYVTTQTRAGAQKLRIIGRVCMDQLLVDATEETVLTEQSEITLFGADDAPSVSDLAAYCHTIPYELLCRVGERVPRLYLQNGDLVERMGMHGFEEEST